MGAILCTLITLPVQVILQFLIPLIQQVITTICNWVSTVISTLITVVQRICGWLPWPLNRLCNWVTRVIRVFETIWDWVCNTVLQIIITIITVIVSFIYYITQVICVIVNIGIGSVGWLLCKSGITPRRNINVCIKILTDTNGQSAVTDLAIEQNIGMLKKIYGSCNIGVKITGIEKIVQPQYLSGTTCSVWGLFTPWHAWFSQNSCFCCSAITVYVVDDIVGASGCAYWGENHCRIANGANFDSTVMAHEIGHLLNLGHNTDPNNLMVGSYSASSNSLTSSQCCTMRLSPYVV